MALYQLFVKMFLAYFYLFYLFFFWGGGGSLKFQKRSHLSLLKIAQNMKFDNISMTVLLASLDSSASDARVVLCIALRLYNMSFQYVCLRNSADSSSSCLLNPQITKYH